MNTRLAPLVLALPHVFLLGLTPGATAQTYDVELVAGGLSDPVQVTTPPEDLDRLFVVEQNSGLIRIIENGALLGAPFLDLSNVILPGGERGLLGLAFHPEYADNGRFFVNYTQTGNGATRVIEYAVSSNPNVADTSPVQTIFQMPQPASNHNGGDLAFGKDGMLYIATGDGGGANDPGNRAQDPLNRHGKMLRFDVDIPAPFIPADNPFVGNPNVLDEIWALGLRNPWRFSFDQLTGDLWIGDVGQNAIEEIDFQPYSSAGGENYGWRCMEGSSCTGLSGCTCNDISLTLPIHEYTHADGCSVTGGYVWRNWELPGLVGSYFFSDFCSGSIWRLRQQNGAVVEFEDMSAELGGPLGSVSGFGQDPLGNVYIVDYSGSVWRIVKRCAAENYCVPLPNSTGAPGLIEMTGSASLANQDFGLRASQLPPDQFLYFLVSAEAGFIQAPGGSFGHLCVVGTDIGRFTAQVGQASSQGDFAIPVDLGALPLTVPTAVQPGDTWFFQAWHRDLNPNHTTNFTDALCVRFCP